MSSTPMKFLVKLAMVRTFFFVIVGWMVGDGATLAQYGFSPINSSTFSPGSEWGNYYVGSAVQLPSWNRPPVYFPSNIGFQPPRLLGIYAQNTPSGVLIGQVVSGSVAERAGLRVGDLIVSVAGTQVGLINGRVVDVMYQVNSSLDYWGRTNALVLDGSTRLMKSVTFDFSAAATSYSSVNGQVFLDSGVPIYRSGVIKVELVNLNRPYLSASGGNTYVQVNGTGPVAFSIPYNAGLISIADRYRLVATYFDSYRQVVSSGSLEIGSLNPGVSTSYSLRLPAAPTMIPYGSAYGVYSSSPNMISNAFRQYLNREPSFGESQAWTQQMAAGILNEKELRAEILASPAFYDRAGNDPELFIKQMIETNSHLPATYEQIQYWTTRLGLYGGNRLQVCREFVNSF